MTEFVFETPRWQRARSRGFSFERQIGSDTQENVAFRIDGVVVDIVGPFSSHAQAARWVTVSGVIDTIGVRAGEEQ